MTNSQMLMSVGSSRTTATQMPAAGTPSGAFTALAGEVIWEMESTAAFRQT